METIGYMLTEKAHNALKGDTMPTPFENYGSARAVIGKVVKIKSHGVTINGNEMMSITLETKNGQHFTYRLSNDSGWSYAARNREYRDTFHVYRFTKADRITGASCYPDCPDALERLAARRSR